MNPTVAILSVGNEVLRGTVANTNAAFLGRELTSLGFDVVSHGVCADSQEAIRFRLGDALRRADLVFMMGGLGPTPDDVTREGIAAHFNVPLVFSAAQYRRLTAIYKRFGKRIPVLVKREAYYPANARPLANRFGIALGFSVDFKGKLVIALPGVPSELENMFFDVVLPLLRKKYPRTSRKKRIIVKMTGISEPDVMKKLGKDFFADFFDFGIYPAPGEVAIRILTDNPDVCRRLKSKIKARLKKWIYAWEDVSLPRVIGSLLSTRREKLAVAESCTGGLLASMLTQGSGASDYFIGGMVTYHRAVKEKLGVSKVSIKKYGEVSEQVAAELAKCVRLRMESDYGLGITGVAGPAGGTKRKPVGLVYIGLADPGGNVRVWKHLFYGERCQIQNRAAVKALEHLWRKIR